MKKNPLFWLALYITSIFLVFSCKNEGEVHINKNLNAELELSKSKNDEIISQNQKLLARLEKLENIALKFQSSSEMISVATKD